MRRGRRKTLLGLQLVESSSTLILCGQAALACGVFEILQRRGEDRGLIEGEKEQSGLEKWPNIRSTLPPLGETLNGDISTSCEQLIIQKKHERPIVSRLSRLVS